MGRTANSLVALAVPIAVGFAVHFLLRPPPVLPPIVRVQHPPAPTEFATLANPFEQPDRCVMLEDVGPDADAVIAVVQAAVPNRSAAWARELTTKLPRVVREVADADTAGAIVEKLQAAGATCAVRDALDVFVEKIAADAATPIGRPSAVVDSEFLTTGRDAIAELRAAIVSPSERTGASQTPPQPPERELAKRAFVAWTTAEGRALFQTNCRPCHGTKAAGDGPMAAGFTLPPANLRDKESLAQLRPGEVLWRIEEGAAALPTESTPWLSAMPAWKHDFDREISWKIVLGAYNTAGAKPASADRPHEHAHAKQSIAAAAGRRLPEKSWLEWPVPARPPADRTHDAKFVERGRYHYYYRCMPCHGVTGHGDGPAANTMWPRPRDFNDIPLEPPLEGSMQPKFKFRTTKQGWLPSDDDLYRTIGRGLVGTAMEGWSDLLAPDDIWAVIAHLKTFSPEWSDPEHFARNPNDPIVVKDFTDRERASPLFDFTTRQPPPVTPQLLADGEEAFRRMQCWQCHGVEARGDGMALGQHHDDWGYRTWPQNLSNPFNYKAGHTAKEIFSTFITSLNGSVMPAYPADTLDKNDPKRGEYLQWALAEFIHAQTVTAESESASRARRGVPTNVVIFRRVDGPAPLDPLDRIWNDVTGTAVPLTGQVLVAPRWQTPSVTQITIKAVLGSDSLAFWFRWDDRRPNVEDRDVPADLEPTDDNPLGPKTFAFPALKRKAPVLFEARDQLEIQIPWTLTGPKGAPITPPMLFGDERFPVLLWRWRAELQGLRVVKKPITMGTLQAERLECTWYGGEESRAAVVAVRANGPRGEFTELAPEHRGENLKSQARWANGEWTLVIESKGFPAEMLDELHAIPFAVHVRDGLAGEDGDKMAISSWLYLVAPSSRAAWAHLAAVTAAFACLVAELSVWRWWRRRARARE